VQAQVQAWNAAQWGNVAQWAGVAATTAAVIVALFKEDFIRRRRHPKLTASIEAKYPDCERAPASWRGANKEGPWPGWKYWLRVWVKNEGNVRAEKVEVFLSRVWMWNNGSFEPLTSIMPMNLRWSYTQGDSYVDGISPDMRRLCDFAAISQPAFLKPPLSETRLSLCLQVAPPPTDWLLPGRYKFEIKIAGGNCEPVTYCIHLHLTGRWDDEPTEMLAHGFTVAVSRGCDSASPPI
jgi:hypothetical protein